MSIFSFKKRIRSVIIYFSLFMALMLFQTSYLHLGTIAAFLSIFLVLGCGFIKGDYSVFAFKLPFPSRMLFLFTITSSIVSFYYSSFPEFYPRLIAQIILFLVLGSVKKLSSIEESYLCKIYVLSSFFYSLLIIRASSIGGLHARIVLFNTTLDPNFVGIPITTSFTLLLSEILNKKDKKKVDLILQVFILVVLGTTIVVTASRGNFVGFVIGVFFVLLHFILLSSKSFLRKLLFLLFLIGGSLSFLYFIENNYSNALQRIISFGAGSDNGRFKLWTAAVNAFKESPVFGVGIGGMLKVNGSASHNTYFELLSETGLVGFSLFLLFIISITIHAFKTNYKYFCMLMVLFSEMLFLDALDNRCVWIILCWMQLLPGWNYGRNNS